MKNSDEVANSRLEKLRELQYQRVRERQRRKRWMLVGILTVFLLLAAALTVVTFYQNQNFEITEYNLQTEKFQKEFRIVLLSDLHNQEFGENNRDLIQAVQECEPSLILMCGDMVMEDDPNVDVILNLCEQLSQTADIYYLLGNHEGVLEYDKNGLQIPLDEYLYKLGVTVCYPGEYTIEHDGTEIRLFSVSMKEQNYEADTDIQEKFQAFVQQDGYKIVASHYPTILYKSFYEEDFDLGIAGHFLGGQIILPGIGGLYHSDTGFFPEYYGGLYELGKGQLIVTRGLGNSSVVPRINNRPELVVININ